MLDQRGTCNSAVPLLRASPGKGVRRGRRLCSRRVRQDDRDPQPACRDLHAHQPDGVNNECETQPILISSCSEAAFLTKKMAGKILLRAQFEWLQSADSLAKNAVPTRSGKHSTGRTGALLRPDASSSVCGPLRLSKCVASADQQRRGS